MEAAKQVQWASVKAEDFGPDDPLPDLDAALRPGILRVGAHIVQLMLMLPPDLDAAAVRRAAAVELRSEHLAPDRRNAIADAIAALSQSLREKTVSTATP